MIKISMSKLLTKIKSKKMSHLIIMGNSYMIQTLGGCLVHSLKHIFSVFKQHYTYFHTFFYSQVFPHMFSNTCFQFLSACTKHLLDLTYNITKKTYKKDFIS